MSKVLIYGGCHAQVLGKLLTAVFGPEELVVDVLINFDLIRSGEPFPMQRLRDCDAFVYSPIENKGDYNTQLIADWCARAGKPAFCYPWMEWHGYSPGATKGDFKGRFQWFYPKLLDMAADFDSFDDFHDHVVARFPDDATIDQTFLASTERLADAERRHDMAIRLSAFVQANYRERRLFLIPDHPALRAYEHVLLQIVEYLGLPHREGETAGEPQWHCRLPILPRVSERLGLTFDDRAWADDLLVPGCGADLATYLRLYFHPDGVVIGPRAQASLQADGVSLLAEPGTRMLAKPLDRPGRRGEDRYEYIATLAGPIVPWDPRTCFTVESELWRQTW